MVRINDYSYAITMLGLIKSGVCRKSNVIVPCGINYQRGMKIINKLVDLGYIVYDGNDLMLTSKGQKFCMFAVEFRDLWGEVLYSRPWLHLFEA